MIIEGCTCAECAPHDLLHTRVCKYCRNKRCPHAESHRHDCTESNEPSQIGSAVSLDGKCPYCGRVDDPMCDLTPSIAQWAIDGDLAKLTAMRLKGEDKIYNEEYRKCLERTEARNRILQRRQQKLHPHSPTSPKV